MKLGSPKSMPAYPKTLLSIAASVGGLALFLIFASLILVYQPIGFKVSGYFYNLNQTSVTGLWSSNNETGIFGLEVNGTSIFGLPVNGTSISGLPVNSTGIFGLEVNGTSIFGLPVNGTSISGLPVNSTSISGLQVNGTRKKRKIVDSGCDLYNGTWVHDSAGPLYSNNSCPVLSQMQNCQGNGRPDKDYENWRWKPTQCDLPRFDPKNFLEMLRGKTLAFIGDSVARNQMESLLCILWQAEVPKNRGNKKMQRYYFRSTSTMIVRIWSSWLIHKTTEKFDFAPEGVDKLHLDAPDQTLIDVIPSFDVLVLSSGHWFAKQSVYILNNEIVGGQLWWPDNSKEKKIDSTEAFEISVNTFISSLVTHPNYTGLTVVRSYSPDHYEGGSWNTGGSCTGKVKPAVDGELVESGFTNMMHDKQVLGFNRGVKKKTNKSRVSFMDITKPFAYRHDGHPGPYRSPDPNKITKRSADGRPPPQDCLHWCMPGPVDMWNEFLMEIIRRDFETEDS